jgi:multidrug efflux system membrane fusion protein
MADEESRDLVKHDPNMGRNYRAHEGDTGAAFEEHNSTLPVPPKKSHTWLWITLLLLLVLTIFLVHHFTATNPQNGGAAAASGAKGGRGQTGPAAITVGESTTGNMNVYVEALGTVTPQATITVYSQVTGVVVSVHYREGQVVRKGEPLVDIDPRPYQATLTQAEGTLERDQAVLAEAKMDLARYKAALDRNAIARQQYEDQEKTVSQDEGTVKTDEGTVAYDKVQLAYCHIVSPISGRVGLRLVDPGNTVFSGSSSTLVVITQLQPITVVFNVSEDNLPQVQAQLKQRKGLEVDAYDRSNETEIEAGKLISLDNQIDTTTGTVKFRANFQNKNLELFPNQFVNARLLVTTLVNATLVPSAAVQQNGTDSFVYIVDSVKNTVAMQAVTVVGTDDTDSAVTGLNPNLTVATSGFDRLEPGAKVLVHKPGQKGSAGSTGASGSRGPSGAQSPASTTP